MQLTLDTLQLDKLSGEDFEKVIRELLKYQGFTDLKLTPKTSDFGADILACKDDSRFAIQIKRSMSPVGITAVQEVLGGMAYYEADKGIVITNALFSLSAGKLASRAAITLVDRKKSRNGYRQQRSLLLK